MKFEPVPGFAVTVVVGPDSSLPTYLVSAPHPVAGCPGDDVIDLMHHGDDGVGRVGVRLNKCANIDQVDNETTRVSGLLAFGVPQLDLAWMMHLNLAHVERRPSKGALTASSVRAWGMLQCAHAHRRGTRCPN